MPNDPSNYTVGMYNGAPQLPSAPGDMLPAGQATPELDEDHLRKTIIELLRNDVMDREEYGWTERRAWDIKAYYGLKDAFLSNWPWPNASNFPQPLTPTLVDTGHANMMASIYSSTDKVLRVKGTGMEDVRKAPLLEDSFNWILTNEVDTYTVQDANVFRTFLHGTGIIKTAFDPFALAVKMYSLDPERVFVPIDASGFRKDQTDHVIQVVPLTPTEVLYRQSLTWQGKPVYKDLDALPRGLGGQVGFTDELLTQARDQAIGVSMDSRNRRDMKFLLEVYLTYYPKNGSGPYGPTSAGAKPQELIVWLGLQGDIQRVVRNLDGVRSYSRYTIYPNPGRFWGISLPEKIRHIQEKLDYADKQNTDAGDKAISPAAFYEEGSSFDQRQYQRVPNGMYPIGRGTKIIFEQTNVNPIFERQLDYCWDLGERLSGLTEVFQGRTPSRTQTLGEAELRTNRAEIRFSALFDRMGLGWKDTMRHFYYYMDKFLPTQRDKMVKILGVNDFRSLGELFPKGMGGKYDFSFSGSPITEIERQKQEDIAFYQEQLANPLVQTNEANLWRVTEILAKARGQKNIEAILTKPQSAFILSATEAIQRVMSGQLDLQPEPNIDAEEYIFRINLFMKTESFARADQETQMAMQMLLRRADGIRQGQIMAMLEQMIMQSGLGMMQPMPPGMETSTPEMPGAGVKAPPAPPTEGAAA